MGKRFLISLVAMMSLGAMGWTDAEAATCLLYKTIGGSSVCCAWSTKGVQAELTFNQDCGPEGVNCRATVSADAAAGDSIAFCKSPTGVITKRECPVAVSFDGVSNQCEPKHEQDGTDTGGEGHDMGKHSCKATITLTRTSGPCESCCLDGETCEDVTPFDMTTRVLAIVDSPPDPELTLAQMGADCSITGACLFEEHCTTNPKRIQLDATKPYQCDLICSGSGCVGGDDGIGD